WEKVNVDIQGDHLIPVVHNRRLSLFWPIFSEKADPAANAPPSQDADPTSPATHLEIKLAWSEYNEHKWTPKQVSTDREVITIDPNENLASGDLSGLGPGYLLLSFKALRSHGDLVVACYSNEPLDRTGGGIIPDTWGQFSAVPNRWVRTFQGAFRLP